MKKQIILALVMVFGICGCNQDCNQTVVVDHKTVNEAELTDKQKITLLQNKTKEMGLRWYVFCVPGNDADPQSYEGVATYLGDDGHAVYIEDGAKPKWLATGDTPANAAYALVRELDHPADYIPDHRPGSDPSCDYNTVVNGEHPNGIPCKQK